MWLYCFLLLLLPPAVLSRPPGVVEQVCSCSFCAAVMQVWAPGQQQRPHWLEEQSLRPSRLAGQSLRLHRVPGGDCAWRCVKTVDSGGTPAGGPELGTLTACRTPPHPPTGGPAVLRGWTLPLARPMYDWGLNREHGRRMFTTTDIAAGRLSGASRAGWVRTATKPTGRHRILRLQERGGALGLDPSCVVSQP